MYTSTVPRPIAPLSLDELLRAIDSIPKEPFGEWMRTQGFPPERCLLLLPQHYAALVEFPPRYVRFSAVIDKPVLVHDVLDTLKGR